MRVPNWLNKDIKTPKPFFFRNYSPPKKSIGSVGTTVLLDTSIACQAFFE